MLISVISPIKWRNLKGSERGGRKNLTSSYNFYVQCY